MTLTIPVWVVRNNNEKVSLYRREMSQQARRPVRNVELGADTDSRTQVWRDFIYKTHRWKLDTRGTHMVRGTRAWVSEIGEYNKGSRGLETKGNMTVRSFLPYITIKYLTDSNEETGHIQGPHSFVGPIWGLLHIWHTKVSSFSPDLKDGSGVSFVAEPFPRFIAHRCLKTFWGENVRLSKPSMEYSAVTLEWV